MPTGISENKRLPDGRYEILRKIGEGGSCGNGNSIRTGSTLYYNVRRYRDMWSSDGKADIPPILRKLHFTQTPLTGTFHTAEEWMIQWENIDNAMFPVQIRRTPTAFRDRPSASGIKHKEK